MQSKLWQCQRIAENIEDLAKVNLLQVRTDLYPLYIYKNETQACRAILYIFVQNKSLVLCFVLI